MTSGWDDVVKEYNFEEDDIVLFCFDPKRSGGLNLLLVHMPIEEEEDDEGEHNINDDDTEDTEDSEEGHDIQEISDDTAEDDHDIYEISDDSGQGQVADDAGQGDPYFQGTCVFGNKFSMNNTQIMHLKDVVDYYPNAPIPQYVYCLTQSSLNKMVSFLLRT
jgi:cobalamin biosynthesis protein CobT